MLIAARSIFSSTVAGVDGDVGSIADLYFNGELWNVRYLVIDTGKWLPGRKVLLAPAAVAQTDWPNGAIAVVQTKQQIEGSPPIDADKPVSRQSEAELAKYYDWPTYWATIGGVAPMAGVPPVGDKPTAQETSEQAVAAELASDQEDPNLRSAKEVKNYQIAATDGEIGHLEDFIVDDQQWIIRYLVINTRNWLPGKSVLIVPKWVESISWAAKRLNVDILREAIKESPPFDPSVPINRRYEEHLFDYYGRETYWK